MESRQLPFSEHQLDSASAILKAVTHPLRLQIINYIGSEQRTNVNQIYSSLGLEQSICSQHLKILRNAEIVHTEREGKYIYYSLNYERLQRLVGEVDRFLK